MITLSLEGIVAALTGLEDGQTLVVQSGKPIAVLPTGPRAPAVLLANGNLVGRWATPEVFYELERRNLIAWGGLTAGCWQYIGSQGVLQGTYETFAQVAREHFGGSLRRAAGRQRRTGRDGVRAAGGGHPDAQAVTLIAEADADKAHRGAARGRRRPGRAVTRRGAGRRAGGPRARRARAVASPATPPSCSRACSRATSSRTSSPI